jgi:hypothetical protein
MAKSLVTLKTEAAQLGIEYEADVKAAELQSLIDAKLAELEAADASEPIVIVEEPIVPAETIKSATKVGVKTMGQLAREAEAKARKTRIITVYDNDPRENGETTVAPVNCSNEYFDLGLVYIPLGEKVEVMQGHIDVLKEIDIPHHLRVNDTTKTVLRKRYTINYEDQQ